MSGERLILDEKWPTHGTCTCCIKQPTATAQTYSTPEESLSKQNSPTPKTLQARSTVEAILTNFIVYFNFSAFYESMRMSRCAVAHAKIQSKFWEHAGRVFSQCFDSGVIGWIIRDAHLILHHHQPSAKIESG